MQALQGLVYHGWGFNTFTYVCVHSSRTVLEHHRSFTSVLIEAELYLSITDPSTLVSQLKEKKKTRAATGNQTQGLLLYKLQVL